MPDFQRDQISFTTPDLTAPVIENITLSFNTTHAVVTSNTTELANGSVKFGTSTALGSVATDPAYTQGQSIVFPIVLNAPNYWNVTACDQFSNCAENGTWSFQVNVSNFTVTANTYGPYQMQEFNVTVNGVTYEATGGEVETGIIAEAGALYDVTISANSDIAQLITSYAAWNTSNQLIFNYTVINITARNAFTNASLSSFTVTPTQYICFQENANSSTDCGLAAPGQYNNSGAINFTYFIDGDYETYAANTVLSSSPVMQAYWYKPAGTVSATFRMKMNATTPVYQTYTVPQSCMDYDPTYVVLYYELGRGPGVHPRVINCANLTGTDTVAPSQLANEWYEDGMFWYIGSGNPISVSGTSAQFYTIANRTTNFTTTKTSYTSATTSVTAGNGYALSAAYLSSTAGSNFTVVANTYNGQQLQNFTVNLTTGIYTESGSTTSGTRTTGVPADNSILLNVTVQAVSATSRYVQTFLNVNAADAFMFNYSIINVSAEDVVTHANLTGVRSYINSSAYTAMNTTAADMAGYFYVDTAYTQSVLVTKGGYTSQWFTLAPPAEGLNQLHANLTPGVTAEIHVRDFLSNTLLDTFNLTSGAQFANTTNGTVYMFFGTGTQQFTINAPGYDETNTSYSFPADGYYNISLQITKRVTFNILDEQTLEPFDLSGVNSTQLSVVCDNQTYDLNLNNTQVSAQVCPWDYIKLTLNYPDTQYFRTLIPDYSALNVTFIMANPDNVTIYQIILRINDLTGQYVGGSALLQKVIQSGTYDIIGQPFDAESKIVAYLIKDDFYKLLVNSADGQNQRNIGLLIADQAGEKTINIPTIAIVPDQTLYGGRINWGFTGNATQPQLMYNDTTGYTHVTTFSVFNASNGSQLLYSSDSINTSSVMFSYVGNENLSVLVCFNSSNVVYNVTSQCALYLGQTIAPRAPASDLPYTADEETTFFTYVIYTVVIIALAFIGSRTAAGALGAAATLMGVGLATGWFLIINSLITITIIVLTAMGAVWSLFVEVNRPK